MYQMAKARQGEPRNTTHDKHNVIRCYADEDQTALIEQVENTSQVIFLGEPYPPCLESHSELQKIYLKDLRVQTHHTGSVLLVRTIGHPRKPSAILPLMNGVEDETSDVEQLLMLFKGTVTDCTPLAKGNILMIKEPFFEHAAAGHYIRVDNPSNLVLLPNDHISVPHAWRNRDTRSALQWKLYGNAALKQGRYLEAIRCYERGLSVVKAEDEAVKNDIHRNLSAAALRAGQYDLAKAEALRSISSHDDLNASDVKALYRAGMASYKLAQYTESQNLFQRLLKVSSPNEEATKMLENTNTRILEEQTGKYDFEAISISSQAGFSEYGSFIRQTEIRASEVAGRGLFTTEDVKCGDVVFCEKSFTAEPNPNSAPSKPAQMVDLHRNRKQVGSYAALLSTTIRKIVNNPSLAHIMNLHTGGTYESQESIPIVDGQPAVDIFRVNRLLQRNIFSFGTHEVFDPEPLSEKLSNKIHDSSAKPVGLWYQASHINHSCIANCYRSFIGDMMIVRASVDIPKGTEITLSYIEHSPLPSIQQEQFLRNWGFECKCKLCISEQHITPDTEMYQNLIRATATSENWKKHQVVSTEVVRRAQESVDMITPLYPEHEKLPRVGVTDHHTMLMLMYKAKGQPDLVAANALQVIRDWGFILAVNGESIHMDCQNGIPEIQVVWALLFLGTDAYKQGNRRLALAYVGLAEEMYIIFSGTMIGFDEVLKDLDEMIGGIRLTSAPESATQT